MSSTLKSALEERNRHLTRYAMHAAISCQDKGTNKFTTAFTNYTKTDSHVEVVLLRQLVDYFGGFQSIPNGCTILVYCSFSPCMDCTKDAIPLFIEKLNPAGRGIRIRFIFQNYYTQANWNKVVSADTNTDTRKMWKDDQTAQNAYDQLRINVGTLSVKESGFYDEQSGKTEVTLKWPWALEIKPEGAPSSSEIQKFMI